MNIIRIIVLFFLGLLARRFYLAMKSRAHAGGSRFSRSSETPGVSHASQPKQPIQDLTEQDISDADFEEIP